MLFYILKRFWKLNSQTHSKYKSVETLQNDLKTKKMEEKIINPSEWWSIIIIQVQFKNFKMSVAAEM